MDQYIKLHFWFEGLISQWIDGIQRRKSVFSFETTVIKFKFLIPPSMKKKNHGYKC